MIYGDLDVSVIDELPPGRTPVQTFVVGADKRQRLYGFVRKLVGEGRQAYIVYGKVEGPPGRRQMTNPVCERSDRVQMCIRDRP